MKNLLCMRELLETVIKDSNKLKAKKRLDSRKDHSGFFDHRSCFFLEARRPSRGVLIFRWHSGCFVLFARNSYKNERFATCREQKRLSHAAARGNVSATNAENSSKALIQPGLVL